MLKITILPGDDIGLEVVPEAVKVMSSAAFGKLSVLLNGAPHNHGFACLSDRQRPPGKLIGRTGTVMNKR